MERGDEWEEKNRERQAASKRKLSQPPFVMPRFIQFIRSPHIASFRVKELYEFSAVNAHLLYGDASKQKRYTKFEHDVSDYMPIWIRLPIPHDGQIEHEWK
jgi:hypothetical protein